MNTYEMGKQQIRKVDLVEDDDELTNMFNSILSGEKAPLEMAWPRYVEMRAIAIDLLGMLATLRDSALCKSLPHSQDSIAKYINDCHEEIKPLIQIDLGDYAADWSFIEEEMHAEFDRVYRALKVTQMFRSMFKSLEAIIDFRKDITSDKPASERLKFIERMPGATWNPLMFDFDLKMIMSMAGVGENTHAFLAQFLANFYTKVKLLWSKTQEPDIDVDKFSDVISKSLGKLRHVPELHRCGRAFDKIASSVDMFKDNFSGYYHNFIDTKDSSSILHEFIMDVSSASGSDARLAVEFRTIVNYYRKMAATQKAADPRGKALFDRVDGMLNKMGGEDASKIHNADRADNVEARRPASRARAKPAHRTAADAAAPDDRDIDELVADLGDVGGKKKH